MTFPSTFSLVLLCLFFLHLFWHIAESVLWWHELEDGLKIFSPAQYQISSHSKFLTKFFMPPRYSSDLLGQFTMELNQTKVINC